MHRCQPLISLYLLKLIAMQPNVQRAMVKFWSSFIISNNTYAEEARTGRLEQTTGLSIQAQ